MGLFQFVCLFVCLFARIFVFETHFFPGRVTRVKLWRRRRKLYKSKAVCFKVDRDTESVILSFFSTPGGILEMQELFSKACFKRTYAYLHLLMSSWNLQENWDSDVFGLGDGSICKGFWPHCILAPRI